MSVSVSLRWLSKSSHIHTVYTITNIISAYSAASVWETLDMCCCFANHCFVYSLIHFHSHIDDRMDHIHYLHSNSSWMLAGCFWRLRRESSGCHCSMMPKFAVSLVFRDCVNDLCEEWVRSARFPSTYIQSEQEINNHEYSSMILYYSINTYFLLYFQVCRWSLVSPILFWAFSMRSPIETVPNRVLSFRHNF